MSLAMRGIGIDPVRVNPKRKRDVLVDADDIRRQLGRQRQAAVRAAGRATIDDGVGVVAEDAPVPVVAGFAPSGRDPRRRALRSVEGDLEEAREVFAKTRATTWIGYKIHMTESCEPGQPPSITHVETTTAPVTDRAVLPPVHPDCPS